jgi:hypothetical protein
MSSRRVPTVAGDASFDYGAQYFTVRDRVFRTRVEQWRDAGQAAPWPAAGEDAWVGTPAMNAPVKQMAESTRVYWSAQIDGLSRNGDEWRIADQLFDIALIATPAEQARPLLQPWDAHFAAKAAATPSAPCWTVMAAFAERLPIAADVLRAEGPIGWAARNSAKAGRSGPECWVVQAGPDWSRQHLEEDPAAIVAPMLSALAERAGGPLPSPRHRPSLALCEVRHRRGRPVMERLATVGCMRRLAYGTSGGGGLAVWPRSGYRGAHVSGLRRSPGRESLSWTMRRIASAEISPVPAPLNSGHYPNCALVSTFRPSWKRLAAAVLHVGER